MVDIHLMGFKITLYKNIHSDQNAVNCMVSAPATAINSVLLRQRQQVLEPVETNERIS